MASSEKSCKTHPCVAGSHHLREDFSAKAFPLQTTYMHTRANVSLIGSMQLRTWKADMSMKCREKTSMMLQTWGGSFGDRESSPMHHSS